MNFKRYNESDNSWTDSHYIKKTDTDIITALPATIYPLAQTATLGLKGNTVQNGTPTSDNPIMPQGCGDLETVGAKAGQFKIPISLSGTTTPVYLGEVETTRKVKKLVLTGQEDWILHSSYANLFRLNTVTDYLFASENITICNAYKSISNTGAADIGDKQICCYFNTGSATRTLYIKDTTYSTATDFKTYLTQQYAAGTPVTVWYVLANETTGIVNEPLMKIGDYADSISGISISTTAGSNSFDVDTTVQPSEVTATFEGWHPVSAAHERSGGAWD